MISSFDLKNALKLDIIISPEMSAELQEWCLMYVNQSSWLGGKDEIKSMNLAATIASEIARMVTVEMKVDVTGSPRADYLATQLTPVLNGIREYVEFGNAKGGIIFKPYVTAMKTIAVDAVQADQFFPIMFDANRKITGVVFVDQRRVGTYYYTRLETHIMEGINCRIRNAVYKSSERETLGHSAPFSDIADWANLFEESVVVGAKQLLVGYYKYPLANNIDPTSPLGVSCISRAKEHIKQSDIQWSELWYEFESGRRALYADETAFDKDQKTGKPILPFKRLYRTLKATGNIGEKGRLFDEWTPTLREENMLRGLNAALRQVEIDCGLAFGTISEPDDTVALTATEIKMSKQRTYTTVTDAQKALTTCLNDLLYAMNVWTTIGKLAPKGKYEATYTYDDSVVTDKDSQFLQDTQVVGLGGMSLIELRMRTYKETKEKAIEMLALANEEPVRKNEPAMFEDEGA